MENKIRLLINKMIWDYLLNYFTNSYKIILNQSQKMVDDM